MKWKSCTPPKLNNKAPTGKKIYYVLKIYRIIDMFGIYMERCFEKL